MRSWRNLQIVLVSFLLGPCGLSHTVGKLEDLRIGASIGPHGGRLKMARHLGPHAHPGGQEIQLYFELVQNGDRFSIYPFVQEVNGGATLASISPAQSLNETKITVIATRRRLRVKTQVTTTQNAIESKLLNLDQLGIRKDEPLTVKLTTIHKSIVKEANFHIERERKISE